MRTNDAVAVPNLYRHHAVLAVHAPSDDVGVLLADMVMANRPLFAILRGVGGNDDLGMEICFRGMTENLGNGMTQTAIEAQRVAGGNCLARAVLSTRDGAVAAMSVSVSEAYQGRGLQEVLSGACEELGIRHRLTSGGRR